MTAPIYILLLLFFTLPFFPPVWHNALVVAFGAWWMVSGKWKSKWIEGKQSSFIVSSVGMMLVLLIGMTYSANQADGWRVIETYLPLLFIPIFVLTTPIEIIQSHRTKLLLFLIGGTLIVLMVVLFSLPRGVWDYQQQHINVSYLDSVVAIHPAFTSMYLSLGVFVLAHQYIPFNKENRRQLGWVIFSVLAFVGFLFWINSRVGLIAFFAGSVVFSLIQLKGIWKMWWLAVLILIFIVPSLREQWIEEPFRTYKNYALTDTSSLATRMKIFDANATLTKGAAAVIGYGTGDSEDALTTVYRTRGWADMADKKLHEHNEYFAVLHRNGLIGLLFFLGLVGIPLWQSIKNKQALNAAFFTLFAVTAMFENVLGSQKSVTFFALVASLLLIKKKE